MFLSRTLFEAACAGDSYKIRGHRDSHEMTEGNGFVWPRLRENILPRMKKACSHLERTSPLGDYTFHRMLIGCLVHLESRTGCWRSSLSGAGGHSINRRFPKSYVFFTFNARSSARTTSGPSTKQQLIFSRARNADILGRCRLQ